MNRERHPTNPIPGAPADSLMGLGGSDGFVGQCERELCLSTPPPPPPEPEDNVTRSYPPIPMPSLPEMPLRARMLRPWVGVAASAVLIAIVGLASGDDDEASPAAVGQATTLSFGTELRHVAAAALDAGEAEAARQAAEADASPTTDDDAIGDEGSEGDERDEDDETASRIASSGTAKGAKGAKAAEKKVAGAFNRDAARSAIFSAASRASGCRTKNGPKGRGRATVTIGPSGGVTSVSVSPPFAGTKSGSCVASVFRTVRIGPFSGSAVTLGKSFTVR